MKGSVNLRSELDDLFDNVEGGISSWVLLRHFDKTKRSKYWDKDRKEAIGGPPYEYTDSVVPVYMSAFVPRSGAGVGVENIEPGAIIIGKRRVYMQHLVTVDYEDELYELSHYTEEEPTIVYTKAEEDVANNRVYPKVKWFVKDIINYRSDDHGRLEYSMLIVDKA